MKSLGLVLGKKVLFASLGGKRNIPVLILQINDFSSIFQ